MQISRVIHRFLKGEAVHVAVPENTGLTFLRGPLTANVFMALMLLVCLVEFLRVLIDRGRKVIWLVEVLGMLCRRAPWTILPVCTS